MSTKLDTVAYDNAIVRAFTWATMIWGVVGFLVGVIIAAQLAWPSLNFDLPWISYGRLRPLHTNAVIFAFAGNGIFAGIYYSLQRVLKTRLASKGLSWTHFWGWQAIIVSAAITLPLGIAGPKEYAELEWPIDLAIALVWVAFGINMFWTIFKRRERHLYVAVWFYIATWVAITLLHLINSAQIPYSPFHSYSVYAGVQDALVQWWYGHNAVAFFLTTPFLGLMYYFLPKASGAPVYSYRLSILHFWSLLFIYIWAGPHHLLNSSLPEWAQTLGVVFSVALIAPSWGGAINGYLTLNGRWDKVRRDPVLWFFVAAITAYTMTTFEGCLLSLRNVNALSHNTDWTIAHVHNGALGWVALLIFGMVYWMVPKLYRVPLYSTALVKTHFILATIGLVLYITVMWAAGIIQGLQQLWFDDQGYLLVKDFVTVVKTAAPFYAARAIAGLIFLLGIIVGVYNIVMTVRQAGVVAEDDVVQVPAMETDAEHDSADGTVAPGNAWSFHGVLERWPFAFTILATITLLIGSIFEIVPSMIQGALSPTIATVKPYTALELTGRDLYIREGCTNCHTQMVRTLRAETERYGAYTVAGEGVYDRPHLWGSKRTGPDLAREGKLKPSALWQWYHLKNTQEMVPGSIMPNYPWLLTTPADLSLVQAKLATLAAQPMNTPYSKAEIDNAVSDAKAQAKVVADELRQDPRLKDVTGIEDSEAVALIAYLKRLGTDLSKPATPVVVEKGK